MMNLDLCWATINLLKRYTDLNRPMAEMGRYYNFKYLSPMIAIIKIIHRDINVLLLLFSGSLQKSQKLSESITLHFLHSG